MLRKLLPNDHLVVLKSTLFWIQEEKGEEEGEWECGHEVENLSHTMMFPSENSSNQEI